jgi:hypothetical protein
MTTMRTTMLRLAVLGAAAASMPAFGQTSPAAPDRDRPAAATEGSTRPGMAAPAPNTATGTDRVDTLRPGSPNQGVAAGQGTAMPMAPRGDAATGTTARTPGTEGGQGAVRVDEGTRMGPLESGANSFTEGQARSRIEAAGFTNLGELTKDDQGIWRTRAQRGGQQVEVGLDYRGNVGLVR